MQSAEDKAKGAPGTRVPTKASGTESRSSPSSDGRMESMDNANAERDRFVTENATGNFINDGGGYGENGLRQERDVDVAIDEIAFPPSAKRKAQSRDGQDLRLEQYYYGDEAGQQDQHGGSRGGVVAAATRPVDDGGHLYLGDGGFAVATARSLEEDGGDLFRGTDPRDFDHERFEDEGVETYYDGDGFGGEEEDFVGVEGQRSDPSPHFGGGHSVQERPRHSSSGNRGGLARGSRRCVACRVLGRGKGVLGTRYSVQSACRVFA